MQFPREEKPAIGIAFDSDLGSNIDDVLALGLLYGFDTMRPPEARLISTSLTQSTLSAAGFCEVVDRFYNTITSREIPERFRRNNPAAIGLALDGKMAGDTPLVAEPLAKRNAEGELVYHHEIEKITDTADSAALIRNAYTAQYDQNALAVLSGPATNFAAVLGLRGAKELIEAKVKLMTVAAGVYPEGGPDPAIAADIAAARTLFAEWPTPIVAVGPEIGEQLLYPASSIENDFGWTQSHPIVDAYRAYKPMPYDAPTRAMAAVLHVVRPDEGYFQLSEPGTITVLDDGRTKFTPSAEGKHRHLIFDAAKKDLIIQTYTQIVSAEPPPRELPRFLRRLLKEQMEEEEKKKLLEQQKQQQSK